MMNNQILGKNVQKTGTSALYSLLLLSLLSSLLSPKCASELYAALKRIPFYQWLYIS